MQEPSFNYRPYIIYNAIRTPDGTVLECKHRHDFKTHLDKVTGETYMNDGLGYYIRRSVNHIPADDLCVTTQDPFEIQRTIKFWKSYGKEGEYYPDGVVLALQDMSDDHIAAILETQKQIDDSAVEGMFHNEVLFRKTFGISVKD